ncbi:hypothetical protein TRAPUB_977 [Trametes pubescens]|uniref:N-acetyltransferase domain-containing protein n=1 Tax=Trametes pubescens TaxID=154538 RepID=A0A1M2VKQ1_TRAPU|nr:hypothetical protein TRAPUB_977 [Trametes pubescens]
MALETEPLLKHRKAEPADVKPMRYLHLWRALDTTAKAFATGSLVTYLDLNIALQAPDAIPVVSSIRRWLFRLTVFASGIYQGHMLTIGGGTAFVLYGTPNQPNKSPWWARFFIPLFQGSKTPEYIKRKEEYHGALDPQVKEALGASVDEMYEIQALATAPKAQRRGYARQLIKTVTDIARNYRLADAEGRDTWVTTSDGSAFYEAQGFEVLRVVTLGTDNPTYHGEPVKVHLMRRPAKAPVLEDAHSAGTNDAVA